MDRFEQLFLQMDDGAFAVDSRRRIVFWNPACERLLGVPAQTALGRSCCEVVGARKASGERYCGARCALAGLAQGGAAPKPMPLWFDFHDGRRQPFWVSVFLFPSPRQDLWHVMHVLQRKPGTLGASPTTRRGGEIALAPERCDAPLKDESPELTPREKEVLGLLALGQCVAQIARRLYLSPVTVRNHVQHLMVKLGLHSQLEAVAYAYRNDLVAPGLRNGTALQSAAGRVS